MLLSPHEQEHDNNIFKMTRTLFNDQNMIDKSRITIFFNIFIPNGDKSERALEITKSQMEEIRRTSLMNAEIICNIYGNTSVTIPLCETMDNCRIQNSNEVGNEKDTLLDLYEYCSQQSENVVIYLHNKGSFHDSPQNNDLRTMHMRAQVETSSCRDAVVNTPCNVCSARFSPLPHFHTSGNMWTAHCSYVKKLISPKNFEQRMEDVIASLRADQDTLTEMFPCTPGDDRDCVDIAHIGMQRYSYEHWIHSHPTVLPCDVLPNNYTFVWNYNNIPNPLDRWTPDLKLGPRFPLQQYLNSGYLPKSAKWFTLKGRLFEWENLFKKVAPEKSWVWYYYAVNSWQ